MATSTRTRSAAAVAATQYRLINTGRVAVVYDEAGHSIGGGERLTVLGVDAVGQTAVDRRYLMLKPLAPAPEPTGENSATE